MAKERILFMTSICKVVSTNQLIIGKRACRFPGDPNNGRVTPVKFLYELGDRILIQVSYRNSPSNFIYC